MAALPCFEECHAGCVEAKAEHDAGLPRRPCGAVQRAPGAHPETLDMRACKRDCVAENVVEAEERVLGCDHACGALRTGGSRTAPPAARSTPRAHAGEVKVTPLRLVVRAGPRRGPQVRPAAAASAAQRHGRPGEASGGRGLLADGRPPEHRRERRRVPQHPGGACSAWKAASAPRSWGARRMSGPSAG